MLPSTAAVAHMKQPRYELSPLEEHKARLDRLRKL